jgi:hypothetical protein
MRTRPAVAVTVLAALAGAAGIVAEAAFGIPTPTWLGVAQPHYRRLTGPARRQAFWPLIITIFRGGRLPWEVTRA